MAKIPENKTGNFEIKYKNGVCYLFEGDLFFWMRNTEEEKQTRQLAIDKCKGTVLVGGLGLGCIVEELARKEDVASITVIEKAQAVIDLVWDYIDKKDKCEVVCQDIFDYLKTAKRFDYVYLDVWPHANKKSYDTILLPLRKLAEKICLSENVLCWQEDLMKKQEAA